MKNNNIILHIDTKFQTHSASHYNFNSLKRIEMAIETVEIGVWTSTFG